MIVPARLIAPSSSPNDKGLKLMVGEVNLFELLLIQAATFRIQWDEPHSATLEMDYTFHEADLACELDLEPVAEFLRQAGYTVGERE